MDLSNIAALPLEQLQALKAALDGLTDISGRSPNRPRQLHDLRLLPNKDDPRPTFFWSAEPPRNVADLTRTTAYPRLMWESATGREITVIDAKSEATYTAQGFILTAPSTADAPDLAESIRQQLAMLSPEDQRTLILAAQGDKLARIRESMAGLSEDDLAALVATVEPIKAKKTA